MHSYAWNPINTPAPSAVIMRQVTQSPNGQSLSGPITTVPIELITEIFKFVVLSSEAARSHAVKDLCLVGKHWNDIANATPDLWTKVTLVHPLSPNQLSAVRKRLKASEPKVIDVEIDLREPVFYYSRFGVSYPLVDPLPISEVVAALRGSEHRWRSISISSDTEDPIHEFLGAQVVSNFPALESIDLKSTDERPAEYGTRLTAPWRDRFPVPFGGNGTLVPKLREVSICAVHLDWTSAFVTQFRNLRKLEIKNQSDGRGPTIQQFSALAAASPGLEILDVSGCCEIIDDTEFQPSFIRLPALKNLAFAWTELKFACRFLMELQIPETLETLSLVDTEVGLGIQKMEDEDYELTVHEGPARSPWIFELFAILGLRDRRDTNPSGTWISVFGLKNLSLSWVDVPRDGLTHFLQNAPGIEEIRLRDVGTGVLESVSYLVESRSLPSLKRVYLRWVHGGGYQSKELHTFICNLRNAGVRTIIKGSIGEDALPTPIEMNGRLVKRNADWA